MTPTSADTGDHAGGEGESMVYCSPNSSPVPPAGDESYPDCSASGAEPLRGEEGGQAPRASSRGKGLVLRRRRMVSEPHAVSTSASASASSSFCLSGRRRVRMGSRRGESGSGMSRGGDRRMDDLALPLGMSIAAVIAQVLERRNLSREMISADRLSRICLSAVGESIANVYGERLNSFMANFEGSFKCTLKTLLSINEASNDENVSERPGEVSPPSQAPLPFVVDSLSGGDEESLEADQANNLFNQLIQHGLNQQLSLNPRSTEFSSCGQPRLDTFERSVFEQTRSNDLKTFEIALDLQRLRLKKSQLALCSDANWLERVKISLGISKASFREEKLKSQIQETRRAELLKKCVDCLVAGLFIMIFSLLYGTYIFSFERLAAATSSCASSEKVSKSWWTPNTMTSLTSGFNSLKCHVMVWSRMLFGVLVILALAFSLVHRSSVSGQAMPITFILLLLGVACGFFGKLCVETLGGSGYCWLFIWECLCLLHFFANIYPSMLFYIMNGPVSVTPYTSKKRVLVPYSLRRILFYSTILVVLPVSCGLLPFASPSGWLGHFLSLIT